MILLQYLKPLCDLGLYFGLFGTILSFGTTLQRSLLPIFLLAGIWLLCFLRREKEHPLLPMVLGVGLLPFIEGWADILMFGLAVYYLFRSCSKKLYRISAMEFTSNFNAQIKVVPILILSGLVLGFRNVIEEITIPFLLIYFVSAITLMRMLRADAVTLESPAFLRFNLLSVGGMLGLGFLLSSEASMNLLKQGITWVYFQVIVPILNFILSIFLFIMTQLAWLGRFFFTKEVVMKDDGRGDFVVGIGDMEYAETILVETPEWVKILFLGLVVAVLFYLAYRLLMRFQGDQLNTKGQYATTEMSFAGEATKKGFSLPRRKDYRDKIRESYQGFMAHCMTKGITIPVWMDSTQLEKSFGETPETNQLRKLYLLARYSAHPILKEDARDAKELLKSIKKNSKT